MIRRQCMLEVIHQGTTRRYPQIPRFLGSKTTPMQKYTDQNVSHISIDKCGRVINHKFRLDDTNAQQIETVSKDDRPLCLPWASERSSASTLSL